MRRQLAFCAALLALIPACAQAVVRLPAEDFAISKMIPKEGDVVKLGLTVLNEGPTAIAGHLSVSCSARSDGGEGSGGEFARVKLPVRLEPGARVPVQVTWKARANGWWRLGFAVHNGGNELVSLSKRLAVTKNDVYFAWFGEAKQLRWCNVPTTVKDEDVAYWLRRGAVPCAWRGAECYKDWSLEKFVEHYASSRWIAIDEIGGPGPSTDKFMQALKIVKQKQPDQYVAVWTMGAHKFWADVQDRIDLFIPEIYLNYGANHLGQFDAYFRTVRAAGMMSKTVAGLGINIVKDDKTGQVTALPTKDDVLRQFIYLKANFPDTPGVGFFFSDGAPTGLAEYADELCSDYFVKPVISFAPAGLHVEPRLGRPGSSAYLKMTVRNTGNMDCAGATIAICRGTQFRDPLQTVRTPRIPVGQSREVEIRIARPAGVTPVSAHLVGDGNYTVLGGTTVDVLVGLRAMPAGQRWVYAPAADAPRVEAPAFAPAGKTPERAREIAPDGTLGVPLPTTRLTGGELAWTMPGVTAAGQARCFALEPSPAPTKAPTVVAEAGKLIVTTDAYRAVLDPAKDELASLIAAGSQAETLKGPWSFTCAAHTGIGPVTREIDGSMLRVKVPFDNPQASGETTYVFSGVSAAIEIARTFKPKAPLELAYAADRCDLEQRGGTYALQAGVGGPVQRGKLIDGTEYRDLLFGYLGEAPSPDTARKCGWLDMSFAKERGAGLGVVILERWADAASKAGYDVTRLYDAADWLEVPYLWNIPTKIVAEQRSRIVLLPHGYLDLARPETASPAEGFWDAWHGMVKEIRR